MYSGECVLAIENLKYFIAAVNYFKIVGLYAVFSEDEYQNFGGKLQNGAQMYIKKTCLLKRKNAL